MLGMGIAYMLDPVADRLYIFTRWDLGTSPAEVLEVLRGLTLPTRLD